MTGPSPSATTDRSAETRQKLLEAAGPIFAEKGLSGVTVREICGRAGVNIAAIHYHFGDKSQLYTATVRYARERRAEQYPFPRWDDNTPAERRLGQFIETILHRMLEPDVPWQTRLLMREVLQPTEACRSLVEDYFRPDFERLMGILFELLPEGVSEECCRKVAFSVMGQCILYRIAGGVVRQLVPSVESSSSYGAVELAGHISRFSVAACRGWADVTSSAGE